MEMHYERTGRGSEIVCTFNPRVLQEEIEKKVESEKLTTVNICRTILALFYGSELREDDFYVTKPAVVEETIMLRSILVR